MRITYSKPIFSLTLKKALCTVLAVLIAYCSLMNGLPGFAQAMAGHSGSQSLSISANNSLVMTADSTDSLVLSMEHGCDNANTYHADGASICSADVLSSDSSSSLYNVVKTVIVMLFYIAALYVISLALPPILRRFKGFSPPFFGHLRTHLGLRRIHV